MNDPNKGVTNAAWRKISTFMGKKKNSTPRGLAGETKNTIGRDGVHVYENKI